MSNRTPTPEQCNAIEHTGGVLLRAGAGSGKTFVLVEHIVYLTRSWISEFPSSGKSSLEEFLRQKFSQVVMMTFTKKAAGEMNIRLADRFSELAQSTGEETWIAANDAIPMLTVTTIDGFCLKLITSGYFPHLSTETKIIFKAERISQVKDLLIKWWEARSHHFSPEVLDIVMREKKELLKSFSNIFNDPGLRSSWKNFAVTDARPGKLGGILLASFKLNDLESSLQKINSLIIPAEEERSPFETFVSQFQATGLPVVDSLEKLNLYNALFSGKRLDGERRTNKKTPAHTLAHEGLKEIRDWLRNWENPSNAYLENFESKILPWVMLCKDLFSWMDGRLDPNQGMTFGDVAFFVNEGLSDTGIQERVQRVFKYFIVDEFQDTSSLQFSIMRKLIGNDFSRLFCVGDAKQAIYGFRGGELSVFQDCSDLVPKVLSLSDNYRSLPEIISFNNSLFKAILPLGQNFQGHDPFSVTSEDQKIPASREEQGRVEVITSKLEINPETEEKFSNEQINRLEATLLAEAIINDQKNPTADVSAVLYSKLRPSYELIRILMEKRIGFTAQYKIEILDDPVIGMFLSLIRRQYDTNPSTKNTFSLFVLKSYFNILDIPRDLAESSLDQFDLDIKYWGILDSFRKFLHSLSITNENFDTNIEILEILARLYHQDPESMMIEVSKGDTERISLDLRSGNDSHKVQIMTAHASKGLEFENVYLGGIYTNGRDRIDGPLFGNYPGSFKWYQDLSLRDKVASPHYLFEQELSKYKNFSESKRLFYVACTRARKKLCWIDFEITKDIFSIPGGSWIEALSLWLSAEAHNSNVTTVRKNEFSWREVLNKQSISNLPLFFYDPVGIFSKGIGHSELAIVPELSVTRLGTLTECPRKFYLSNTLKLDEPDTPYISIDTDEEIGAILNSSADRGTYIHAQISQGILRNFVVPRESFNTNHKEPIEWALKQLELKKDDFLFLSEQPIKFKLFNFMISGIPDLILLPKEDQSPQIWDFKTGKITQDNLPLYWTQLGAYAYALYVTNKVPRDAAIDLVLCFVDQKKNHTLRTNFTKCSEELFSLWRSQNEPWKTNPDHCSQCSYGTICPR